MKTHLKTIGKILVLFKLIIPIFILYLEANDSIKLDFPVPGIPSNR